MAQTQQQIAASIARKQEIKAVHATVTMTLRDETRTIAINNVPFGEKLLVRQQTGEPWEAFLAKGGSDSYVVVWWIARRLNGEPKLTLDEVVADWPDDLTDDDVTFDDQTTVDETANDPEA